MFCVYNFLFGYKYCSAVIHCGVDRERMRGGGERVFADMLRQFRSISECVMQLHSVPRMPHIQKILVFLFILNNYWYDVFFFLFK